MPRNEEIYQVFLATPSDLADEREIVETTIDSINSLWRKRQEKSLELLDWEKSTYPSVGEDAQDVINQQIGDDYDIFIGIMWTRFGTPTNRADSGTQEEFKIALSKYKSSGKPHIMFYFKTKGPNDLNSLDLDQLQKVKEFKKNLQSRGVLYSEFKEVDEFKELANMHLTKIYQSIDLTQKVSDSKNVGLGPTPVDEIEDEEGYFDLILEAIDQVNISNSALDSISSDIRIIGNEMEKNTAELDNLKGAPNSIGLSEAKRVSNKLAGMLEDFSKKASAGAATFSKNYKEGIRKLLKVVTEYEEFEEKDTEKNLESFSAELSNTLSALTDAKKSIEEYLKSLTALPRTTTKFNRAKRLTRNSVQELINEFHAAKLLITEALEMIKNEINRRKI